MTGDDVLDLLLAVALGLLFAWLALFVDLLIR